MQQSCAVRLIRQLPACTMYSESEGILHRHRHLNVGSNRSAVQPLSWLHNRGSNSGMGKRFFSLQNVQTGSAANRWVRWPEREAATHLLLVSRLRRSGAIHLLLLYCFMAGIGTASLTKRCTLSITHKTLHTQHHSQHAAHSASFTKRCTLSITHNTLHTQHHSQHAAHSASLTKRCTLSITHNTLHTQHHS